MHDFYRDPESQQREQFGREKFTPVAEINKSKTDSESDIDQKVEALPSNDDHTQQLKKTVDVESLNIKGAHQAEKHGEHLVTKPSVNEHSEDDSEVQKMASKTDTKQSPKCQQYGVNTRDDIQYKPIKSGYTISHAKIPPSIKPSKSCNSLGKIATMPSKHYRTIQKPTFYKSSGDLNISVHIYEAIDVQSSKGAQMFKPCTNMIPAHKGPCLSKETLRAGYKHREPPPDPKKTQSKEDIDVMHADSTMSSDTNSNKHPLSGGMAQRKLQQQYKPRPPPPTVQLQGVQPSLSPKGQSSIQACNTSSSESSSTSEDVLSFLWSKGVGTEIPTKLGQLVSITSQHESGVVYQPLNAEVKAPLDLYECLNKCSDTVGHTEPRSFSGDKSDQAGAGIDARESTDTHSTVRYHKSQIGKVKDGSDSEDDYMPLVPKRKKNTVVTEYASLQFVQQNQ